MAEVHDNLVVLDLRNEPIIYAGNRFVVYAMYPQCDISMHVMWGREKMNTVYTVGKSIFDRGNKVMVGELMLSHGGGGHHAAGTCQGSNETAERNEARPDRADREPVARRSGPGLRAYSGVGHRAYSRRASATVGPRIPRARANRSLRARCHCQAGVDSGLCPCLHAAVKMNLNHCFRTSAVGQRARMTSLSAAASRTVWLEPALLLRHRPAAQVGAIATAPGS